MPVRVSVTSAFVKKKKKAKYQQESELFKDTTTFTWMLKYMKKSLEKNEALFAFP